MIKLLIFSLSLVRWSQSRTLWERPLPEIYAPISESRKSETKVQIANLDGILQKSTLSELKNVTEIRIVHNQIRQIEPGALCRTNSLKILELDLSGNRKPPVLTKGTFEGCNLEELFLKFDYNDPSTMDGDALENLTNLRKLGIDSLSVPQLKKDLVKINTNLKSLTLSNLHVTTIDENFFQDMPNLEEIAIVHNIDLTHIPENLFKNCTKLTTLVLKDNAINDLSWDEFRGLALLEELDVGDNRLNNFDVEKIATNMPNLRKLSISLNEVEECDKRVVVKQLKTKLKKLQEISPDDEELSGHVCSN